MYFIDQSNAQIVTARQYLLNFRFLKSSHHTTRVIHASIANINDIKELSENTKNHIIIVNTDWNSQKGTSTLIFSFLYQYCSNSSQAIDNIEVRKINKNK